MSNYAEQLAAEYQKNFVKQEDFTRNLRDVLSKLTKNAGITLVAMEDRERKI